MDQKIDNDLKECNVQGDYVGGNQTKNFYISMYQESERKFVVTHNSNIKSVSYFTGRETELQDLRQRIEEGRKSVLVSGMGGIGKTQICRKLFEEYYISHDKGGDGPFSHIGYIEYSGDMDSSLIKCLRYKEQDTPELNKEAAWKELEDLASEGKILLFIDNVDKSAGADAGLKRLSAIPGAIVLTSRRTSLGKEFELLKIDFLSTEQCIKIYEKIRYEDSGRKVPEEDVPELEYVIVTLAARHTITIEFLAHLAETKRWGVKRLRDELQDKGFCLEYRDEEDKLVNIQKSYETLYSLSGLSLAEQNILEAFSVFPYIPLAADVCNQWLLSDAGVGEDSDILIGLYRKGWLQFDIEQESFSIHPVFAQFMYEKCKPSAENHLGLLRECQECMKIPNSGSALECQRFIPFAENIVEKAKLEKGIEQAEFIGVLAYLLQYIAQYKKAATLYEKSLKMSEDILGEEHPDVTICCNNLASVYGSLGEYIRAEELYKKSLSINEKVLGGNHLDVTVSYNNLAGVYVAQGSYEKAEELYRKSLGIRKRVLGENHPDISTSYNNLAYVYAKQGSYEKAEELYKKSLSIRKRMLGENHLNTAESYNNLAYVYKSQGEYGKAKELYEKGLGIYERVLGDNHPYTATLYNNLAGVYFEQGHYDMSEKLNKKCLRIHKMVLGKNHPDTAMSYNNLAAIYTNQGKYQKALDYCFRAYKVYFLLFGPEHPSTRLIHENLIYLSWKQYGNFEQWLEEQMKK